LIFFWKHTNPFQKSKAGAFICSRWLICVSENRAEDGAASLGERLKEGEAMLLNKGLENTAREQIWHDGGREWGC